MSFKVPQISICVVAKNAGNTTRPLFNSLREFADRGGDMVLVDTGSTDDTVAVYKAFGFRVFEVGDKFMITIPDDVVASINEDAVKNGEPNIVSTGDKLFNFSEARNYAASMAKNDYIINPDADEALTVFNIDAVEEKFKTISRFRYDFVFSHNEDGSPNIFFITDTRASDRRYWKWKGHVHETNEPIAPGAIMDYVQPSIFKVEHFQVPSPTRGNYLAGLAYACHLEPGNDRNLHYYGRELMYRGLYKTAIDKLTKHIQISRWDTERGQSLIFIGECYRSLGDENKAVEYWHKAIEEDGTRREAWLKIADYHFRHGRPHHTISYASGALALPLAEYYGNRAEMYTYLPHHYLYWGYQKIGQQEKAQDHWMMALSYDPGNKAFQYDAMFFRRKAK